MVLPRLGGEGNLRKGANRLKFCVAIQLVFCAVHNRMVGHIFSGGSTDETDGDHQLDRPCE